MPLDAASSTSLRSNSSETVILFLNASTRAFVKGRVETSLLTNLIKDVGNTHEEISREDFDTIKSHEKQLAKILNKQGSKDIDKKLTSLLKAVKFAEDKIPHSVLAEEHKVQAQEFQAELDKHKLEYNQAVKVVERLDSVFTEICKTKIPIDNEINDIIGKFRSFNVQRKARDILGTPPLSAFSDFDATSLTAILLFPPIEINGKKISNPELLEWAKLKSLAQKQFELKTDSQKILDLKNQTGLFSSIPANEQEHKDFHQWAEDVSAINQRYIG